ncbi:MAG: hypothetical protein ABL994_02650 [Verrucomicrobiales bacterium]
MKQRHMLLVKGIAALISLWGIAYAIVCWAGSVRPTPEKVAAYIDANPLEEIDDPEKRKEVIGTLATMLNELEPSENRLFEENQENDPRRNFIEQLSPEEQFYFLEKRVGRAFQQMMLSFNEMDRDERKQIVERSLKRMKEQNDDSGGLEKADPEVVEKITGAGLKAYYEEASAETKIDLAPLLEEMQRSMTTIKDRK